MKKKNNIKSSEFVKVNDFSEVKNIIESSKNHEEFSLFVKSPFRNYSIGDFISDRNEVDSIINSHESSMVIKKNNK